MEGYVDCYYIIADMEGLDMRYNPNHYKEFVRDVYMHFPARLHRMAIVNAGIIFRALFMIVKPFLTDATREKIVILGTKPETIKESLSKDMDEQIIPKQLGGLKTI